MKLSEAKSKEAKNITNEESKNLYLSCTVCLHSFKSRGEDIVINISSANFYLQVVYIYYTLRLMVLHICVNEKLFVPLF